MTERPIPDADARLDALLRTDPVAERDPLFRIAVLQRLERERFRRQMVATLTVDLVQAIARLVRTPFALVRDRISRSFVG